MKAQHPINERHYWAWVQRRGVDGRITYEGWEVLFRLGAKWWGAGSEIEVPDDWVSSIRPISKPRTKPVLA